jgi:two-component system phosphate regulon sensor histidine kinase PhoR
MKRRFFGRIILLYAIMLLIAGFFIELYITNAVRNGYIDDVRDNLLVQASLFSDDGAFKNSSSLDALCKRFKQRTNHRVTVIAPDGRVLGESDRDAEGMENHLNRPEIQQALLDGSGMSIRYSATLQYDLLYVAKLIKQDTAPVGVVRISVPLASVDAAVNALRFKIILVVLVLLTATGLFAIAQMDRIRRLTKQVNAFSRSLAGGAAGNKLYVDDAGEFSEIADSLNTMSNELLASIAANEAERRRLNEILRSMPDVLLVLEANGAIRLASAASAQYFGDAPLVGKQVFEVIRVPQFLQLMDEARKSTAAIVGELTLGESDERHFSVRISPLYYRDDELSGFIVILHDITQLKKLEQIRKDFVANISHEIKTPITAIKGFADTLLEGALHDTEHAEKFLSIIKSNSERINSLVDDLMIISKIELGVVKIEKASVDVADVFEHVAAVLGPKAEEKKLYLKTELAPQLAALSADKDKLIQVLMNMVDNAIKFTEKGGVTLGATLENGRPCLYVLDTGIGILEKHLPRLGERFYRVDTGRSRKMGGTGLGLAIVKHLVKAHGWDLRIESAAEKWTKVSILCG